MDSPKPTRTPENRTEPTKAVTKKVKPKASVRFRFDYFPARENFFPRAMERERGGKGEGE